MKLTVPSEIQIIVHSLTSHGYEAYYVGGCVRDAYMGNTIHDYDVTTNATCEEMLQIYQEPDFKVFLTGIKHGTICVVYKQQHVEITTYRTESSYENHRFPTHVAFTLSLHEDLKRRDFTMNALAYGMDHTFVDLFGGCGDISNHIIRCVGNPHERLKEDALRILRCLRFAHRFQFDIEEKTKQACLENLPLLRMISIERVRDELFKMLMDKQPHILEFLDEFGILQLFLPDIKTTINIDTLSSLALKLASLFPTSKLAYTTLKQLKCGNSLIQHVSTLVTHQSTILLTQRSNLRHVLYACHNDFQLVYELIELQQSNQHATSSLLREMEREQDYYDLKKLAIHGDDLLVLGYYGPIMKTILNDCLMLVLNDPTMNQKGILIDYVKVKYRQEGCPK